MDTLTDGIIFEEANRMPAITWHWLRMNETQIEIPEGLDIDPQVIVDEPFLSRGAADEFENAMADAQEQWEEAHPEPTADEVAAMEEVRAAEADATYGGTALSAYQEKADVIEASRSLMASFENGTGADASAYLRYAAGDRIVVKAERGETVSAKVMVSSKEGVLSVAAIDVIADKDASIDLSLLVCSEHIDPIADDPDEAIEPSQGLCGTTVRVFADEGATVNVIRTQALAEGITDIDDMGFFASTSARINLRQTILGATRSYTGMACDLRGDESNITIDTRYLGHGVQERDLNYIVRHHGQKTESDMGANGVLTGKSSKVLRGTLDFVRGCCGSEGSESETVLLVDQGVRNKTVPTMLCNEDDVMGNHGATIGHVREEQLFYLMCRGLSQEAAERMFATALIEQAVFDAPDTDAREAVVRLGAALDPAFAVLYDEEA